MWSSINIFWNIAFNTFCVINSYSKFPFPISLTIFILYCLSNYLDLYIIACRLLKTHEMLYTFTFDRFKTSNIFII